MSDSAKTIPCPPPAITPEKLAADALRRLAADVAAGRVSLAKAAAAVAACDETHAERIARIRDEAMARS